VYLHEVIAEYLLLPTHCIWKHQFPAVYEFMMSQETDSEITRIEHQFEVSVMQKQNESKHVPGNLKALQ